MTSLGALRFLTEDPPLRDLCTRYWATDGEGKFIGKVSALAEEHDLSVRDLTGLVAANCEAPSSDRLCASCGTPYVYKSRTDYLSSAPSSWQCGACTQKSKDQQKEVQQTAEQKYRAVIETAYGSRQPGPVDLYDQSLENAVYLLSFIRRCAAEDFSYAVPLESLEEGELLSPMPAMDREIVTQLFHAHLIAVHPGSPRGAFEGEAAERYYPHKVFWRLPFGPDSDKPRDLSDELEAIFKTGAWPAAWFGEAASLWQKLALQECLQYLTMKLGEYKLELKIGEKTLATLTHLLEAWSVGQVFSFIWTATRDAAAFYQRGNVTKTHAANTVVGAMSRQAERAKADGWTVSVFRRDNRTPQSMVSHILYNVVLGLGEKGLTEVPGEAFLEQFFGNDEDTESALET